MDFENKETNKIFFEELMPTAERLARSEFGTLCTDGLYGEEDIADMKRSKQQMVSLFDSYLQVLLDAHIKFAETVKEAWPPAQ